MSSMFGGNNKSRDIEEIINQLRDSSICNEATVGSVLAPVEIENMAESVKSTMYDHYSAIFPEQFDNMLD